MPYSFLVCNSSYCTVMTWQNLFYVNTVPVCSDSPGMTRNSTLHPDLQEPNLRSSVMAPQQQIKSVCGSSLLYVTEPSISLPLGKRQVINESCLEGFIDITVWNKLITKIMACIHVELNQIHHYCHVSGILSVQLTAQRDL